MIGVFDFVLDSAPCKVCNMDNGGCLHGAVRLE